MRTHTTYTDLRRIMKLHGDGVKPEDISAALAVALSSVKHVIDVRTSKKTKKGKAPETT